MNPLGSTRGALLAILGTALVVRVAYLYWAVDTPLFDVLLIDSEFYDRRGREIAAGDWLGDSPFFMNPLYPYFLAAIYVVLGVEYAWVGIVQALMGVGSCLLLYGLGVQIWGEREGLLAAGLGALYGPYVFYDGALLTAAPITFLNLFGLYGLFRADRGSARWLVVAGLALGLSALARPLVLLFVAAAGCWFAARGGWGGLLRWGRLAGGCGLVVAAVVVRNYAIGGEWLLTTSSAGMNFYVGNHPGANGIYTQVDFLPSAEPEIERRAFVREAESRTGHKMSPGAASRYWLREGLVFIWDDPGAYVRLLGRKTYMFFNGVEAQNNLSIYLARDWVPVLRWLVLGWGWIAPIALAQWLWAGRCHRSPLLDLYFMSYLAGCLVFFVSSEYRLPVVPVLLLYASRGLLGIASVWASGGRCYWRPVLLALLLAIPINYRDAAADRLTHKRVDYYNFGTLYQRSGDWQGAAEMYRESLRIDPEFMPARSGLANALAEQANQGRVIDVEVERGLDLYGRGEYEMALREFEAVRDRNGLSPRLANNIGLCLYKLGRYEEAIPLFERALVLNPEYVRAHFNLGLVAVARGDDGTAASAFARVLALDAGHAKALYRRGAALTRLGRYREAEVHWAELKRAYPGDMRLQAKIDSMTRAEQTR